MYKLTITIIICLVCNFGYSQYDKPYADSLQVRLDSTKFDTVRVRCLIKLGLFYLHENPQKAEGFLLKSYNYKLPASPAEQGYKAYSAEALAEVYQQIGNNKLSYEWLMKAYSHTQKTYEAKAVAMVYEQLATYYRDTDKYDSSIYFSQQIINLWDSLKKPNQLSAAYYSISNTFQKMSLYKKAFHYLELAKKNLLETEGENATEFLSVYSAMAELEYLQGHYDSTVYYCNKAYPIMVQETALLELANLLAFKSDALIQLKKYKEAETAAAEGYKIAVANNQAIGLPRLCATLAISKAYNNQKDSALWYAKKTEEYFKKTENSKEDVVGVYNMWANVYTAFGNYKEAAAYREKELQAFKEFKAEELGAIAARSEVQFETAKKEQKITELKEIAAQQRKIQWLIIAGLLMAVAAALFAFRSYRNKKKAADVLEQSNKEKEVFLKEIHHRVKNNLQIISSLIYMQFKDTRDEKMIAQLKQAQDRIKSMALVHNKLYETNDVVHVYLQGYIKDLAMGILSSNTPVGKDIQINFEETNPINLSLDTSISVGLILNELITNSCKYAFANQEKGTIKIKVEEIANQYQLTIEDDGSGLPEGYEQKSSLGLRLVKNLARQLNGSVSFNSDNGTIIKILFKDSIAA